MRAISQTSPAKDFTPTPRRGVNVSHFLTQTARRLPERLAVVDDDHGQRWTWAELDARAEALAAALQAGGVGRRDTVLLLSANHAEVIQSFWGILRAGGVIAPPNAALSTEELLGISAEVAPAAVIADRAHSDFVTALQAEGFTGPRPLDRRAALIERTTSRRGDRLQRVLSTRSGPLGARTAAVDSAVDEDDPCWYFFTSGSTGRPKAATFTHRHLGAVLTNHRCDLFPDEDETGASLVLAPLSHGAGIHMLATGLRRHPVDHPPRRQAQPVGSLWPAIDAYGITNAFTVPTILNRIVAGLPGRPRTRGPHLGARHLRRGPDARRPTRPAHSSGSAPASSSTSASPR
jgi:fatty-acyl-CoA synthase